MSLLSTSTIKTMISAPIEPLLHALESIRPLSNCTRVSGVCLSGMHVCCATASQLSFWCPLRNPEPCVYVCVCMCHRLVSALFTVHRRWNRFGAQEEHCQKSINKSSKKLIRKICPTFRHYRLQQFFSSAVTPPCALWAGHISLSVSLCLSLFSLLSSL